ncbi:MAG: hypothetical protein ABIN24_01010 [Dyadobacter sp.]
MSQGFKLKYDQMRDGDPSKPNISSKEIEAGQIYRGAGHARSLCLVWPDNTRMFFNYAYLISGSYSDTDERNIIKLQFSGHSIQLIGFGLETLFMQLLEHTPRIVIAIDERYVMDSDKQEFVVIEIVVEKKE